MNPRLVRWLAAVVIITGVIAVAADVVSSPDERHVATTTPRPVANAPSKSMSASTTTAVRPTTSLPAPPTTATSAPPAPITTAGPETTASPTTAPSPVAQPVAFTSEPQPTAAPAPPPEVAIYGDSLTVLSSERYHEISDSEINTHEHAFMGATLPMHRDIILSDTVNRLVLALGTNDAEHDGAKPWADLLNELPATKCVVWPKPYEGSNNMTVFNAQVSAIVAAHPNVHVLDWNARVKPHPEWLEPDQKHYTAEGRNQYAAMLKEAALTCP